MAKTKKPGTPEAWESGELGENLETAKAVSSERNADIQDATGLQLISIRLPKTVIEDFKAIAQIEGVGYQPLMRITLIRFAECEAKRMVREYAAKVMSDKRTAAAAAAADAKPPRKPSLGSDPRLSKKAA